MRKYYKQAFYTLQCLITKQLQKLQIYAKLI